MSAQSDPWVLLATRIPRSLHRSVKVYCVEKGVSVTAFVVKAIEDGLRRERKSRRLRSDHEA